MSLIFKGREEGGEKREKGGERRVKREGRIEKNIWLKL